MLKSGQVTLVQRDDALKAIRRAQHVVRLILCAEKKKSGRRCVMCGEKGFARVETDPQELHGFLREAMKSSRDGTLSAGSRGLSIPSQVEEVSNSDLLNSLHRFFLPRQGAIHSLVHFHARSQLFPEGLVRSVLRDEDKGRGTERQCLRDCLCIFLKNGFK